MKKPSSAKDTGLGAVDQHEAIARAIVTAKQVAASTTAEAQSWHDAAALSTLRESLNSISANVLNGSGDWRVEDVVPILTALQEFMEATMNELHKTSEGISVIRVHPAASVIAAFTQALDDLKDGLIDPRFKRTKSAGGRSLKAADREKIGLALTLVETLKRAKNLTLPEARKRVAKVLKARFVRVAGKEMTEARLKEWAKDFDLHGRKRRGN